MARTRKSEVKESLLIQLSQMGVTQEHYMDLINDYMGLWDVKTQLIRDIRKRGIVYTDASSTGIKQQKNNPSVKELVLVNKQMLSILKELGLSTENAAACNDDEEM